MATIIIDGKEYPSFDEYKNSKEYEIAYTKGYNFGYELCQYQPTLLKSILVNTPKSQHGFVVGLNEGQRQMQHERMLKAIEVIRENKKKMEQNKNRER